MQAKAVIHMVEVVMYTPTHPLISTSNKSTSITSSNPPYCSSHQQSTNNKVLTFFFTYLLCSLLTWSALLHVRCSGNRSIAVASYDTTQYRGIHYRQHTQTYYNNNMFSTRRSAHTLPNRLCAVTILKNDHKTGKMPS